MREAVHFGDRRRELLAGEWLDGLAENLTFLGDYQTELPVHLELTGQLTSQRSIRIKLPTLLRKTTIHDPGENSSAIDSGPKTIYNANAYRLD